VRFIQCVGDLYGKGEQICHGSAPFLRRSPAFPLRDTPSPGNRSPPDDLRHRSVQIFGDSGWRSLWLPGQNRVRRSAVLAMASGGSLLPLSCPACYRGPCRLRPCRPHRRRKNFVWAQTGSDCQRHNKDSGGRDLIVILGCVRCWRFVGLKGTMYARHVKKIYKNLCNYRKRNQRRSPPIAGSRVSLTRPIRSTLFGAHHQVSPDLPLSQTYVGFRFRSDDTIQSSADVDAKQSRVTIKGLEIHSIQAQWSCDDANPPVRMAMGYRIVFMPVGVSA